MNVDGNTFVIIGAAIAVIASIYGGVRKITLVEQGAAEARSKILQAEPRIRALEDRLLLLENNHENHAREDEKALTGLTAEMKDMRACLDEVKETTASIDAALRLRGRDNKDPRAT